MAGGWYVLLETELPQVKINLEGGKALLYFHRHIDDLARQLELPALSAYFRPDRAGVLAYLRDQGVEPDPESLPDEDWFDPADGLVTIRGLLGHLRADPTSLPSGEKVMAEMEEIERVLTVADQEGVRFRLTRKLPPAPE